MKSLSPLFALALLALSCDTLLFVPESDLSIPKLQRNLKINTDYDSQLTIPGISLPKGRLLMVSDDFDDEVINGRPNFNPDNPDLNMQSNQDQINQNALGFGMNYDKLSQQIQVLRRQVPAKIPGNVFESSINSYINNAQIMRDSGALSEEMEDNNNRKLIVKHRNLRKNVISPQRFARITKLQHQNRHSHSKSNRNLLVARKTVDSHQDTLPTAGLTSPSAENIDRGRDPLDFGEFNDEQIDANAPKLEIRKERVLRNLNESKIMDSLLTSSMRKVDQGYEPSIHRESADSRNRRRKSQKRPDRLSAIDRIRQSDELLQLAREGSLFNINMDEVYSVGKEDINKYFPNSSKKNVKI